jgi:hypothetical protein
MLRKRRHRKPMTNGKKKAVLVPEKTESEETGVVSSQALFQRPVVQDIGNWLQ